MRRKKIIGCVSFVLFCLCGQVMAQEAIISSGGNANGSNGSSSYSVGQVVYTMVNGSNESIAQGVQQPFEISTVVGLDERTVNLGVSVYPNPTTNYLTLTTESLENLSFQLYDMQGRTLDSGPVSSFSTRINVEQLPTQTYFLSVTKDSQIIKTFKVVKN